MYIRKKIEKKIEENSVSIILLCEILTSFFVIASNVFRATARFTSAYVKEIMFSLFGLAPQSARIGNATRERNSSVV